MQQSSESSERANKLAAILTLLQSCDYVAESASQYDSHETQQACAVRALEEANRARAEQLKLLTETLSIMAHDDPLRDSVEAQRSRTLQEMGIYSSFSVVGPEAVKPAR